MMEVSLFSVLKKKNIFSQSCINIKILNPLKTRGGSESHVKPGGGPYPIEKGLRDWVLG